MLLVFFVNLRKIFRLIIISVLTLQIINILQAQSAPEILARVVSQCKQAQNIELKINTSVSIKNEPAHRFINLYWMANDSDDIYLYATEITPDKLTNELVFSKYNKNTRGYYYHKFYDEQKEDSAYKDVAYILASGGAAFQLFRDLYYHGQAPFAINKLNSSKDHTCWIKENDTSIYAKSFFVVSMSDTIFLNKQMNQYIKSKLNNDSLKLKDLHASIISKTFAVSSYKLVIEKSNYSIFSVSYNSISIDFSEYSLVHCTLDQPWDEFTEKLFVQRGRK